MLPYFFERGPTAFYLCAGEWAAIFLLAAEERPAVFPTPRGERARVRGSSESF
jgi:hypothetical protein